jgi:hypothetical protein
MLLTNLTTIYQERIPTLTHTQQHAESLSRSHLKYVITGELDEYVTNLIHVITNPTRSTHRILRNRCNPHTQIAPNFNPTQDPPSQATNTRKRPLNTIHTQHHPESPPQHPSNNPPKKTRIHPATDSRTHPPIPRPTTAHPKHDIKPPTTTRSSHPKRKPEIP